MSIKIGVLGASGKMAQSIKEEVKSQNHDCLLYSRKSDMESLDEIFTKSDVIIDFTNPDVLELHIESAVKHKKPIVIGTTGISKNQMDALKKHSMEIPILYSPNTSVGVSVLKKLVEKCSKLLDEEYDIEITDIHHRYKIDSPSGTALMLGDTILKNKNKNVENNSHIDRSGKRTKGDVGFSSIRGGSYVCGHDIHFMGNDETITISHKSFSRNVYSKGAVKASIWITKQDPGLYSMDDVL